MTDREASWQQGFKTLTRLNLTQAELKAGFFSIRWGISDFKTWQPDYILCIIYKIYIHKMHRAEVKRFIVQ